jgi:iron complex outermembrane receptor protein
MKIGSTRGRIMASTMLCGALAIFAAPAYAQDAAKSDTDVTEIVVTGSRLQRKDFVSTSPVATVGSEQLKLTGTIAVEQLLNELPQIVPGNTVTSNNSGGEDFATIDLRGLGAQRTLVVVNGERVPGSSTTGVVDLNTIPAGLIDRIEVLTGGASAVYGSDAMAGVVNFVLKDNYEGAEISAQTGGSMSGRLAKDFNLEGLLGGNFANGKGNMTMYASYYKRDPVLQSEFDWSKVSAGAFYDSSYNGYVIDSAAEWNAQNAKTPLYTFASGGSGTPPWGWIANNAANPFRLLASNPATSAQFASANTDCNAATPGVAVNGGNLSFNDAGQLTPRFTSKACAVPDRAAGSSRYNYAPTNDIIIPAERYAISSFGSYQINPKLKLKTQMSYVDSRSGVQLAATPATGLTVVLTSAMQSYINSAHPDLAAALASRPNPTANFQMDWRSLQLGPRVGEYENQSMTLLATLDGEINDNWNWSATSTYGRTHFSQTLRNNLNKTAIGQGLAGCQAPVAGSTTSLGVPGPANTAAALPGCVITDIFGQNKLSAAAVKFLRTDTHQINTYEERRLSAFVRGDAFQLPAGPVSTVVGYEYRESRAALDVDAAQSSANIYGFNAIQNQKGSVVVQEIYGEVGVPLVKDLPFAKYIGIEGGYRYSDYDTIGTTETYKVGGEWAVVDWLKFRTVYNKAVRAPSVFELFQNGDQGFPSYTDPCKDSANRSAAVLAICNAQAPGFSFTGFAANNSQVQALSFGNPNLKPETGKTFTAGVVFQPTFLPIGDLKMSVDYFDIKIEDAVGSIGAGTVLSRCYVSLQANECAKITRNTVTGQIDSINTSIANLSEISTKGVDIQTDYRFDLSEVIKGTPGRIAFNALISILDSYATNGVEQKGYTSAGVGGSTPEYKSVMTGSYQLGDWMVQARWTYTPEMTDENADYGLVLPKTEAASYIDLSGRWNVNDNLQLNANIGNLLDKDPPQFIAGVFSQGNTDPQVYRVLGRTFNIAARLRF